MERSGARSGRDLAKSVIKTGRTGAAIGSVGQSPATGNDHGTGRTRIGVASDPRNVIVSVIATAEDVTVPRSVTVRPAATETIAGAVVVGTTEG